MALKGALRSWETEYENASSSLLVPSSSLLASSRSLLARSARMRLRTSIQEMPKSKTLAPMPLASTKAGRLLSAPFLNPGNVAKYRLHSVFVVEERARRNVGTVIYLEVYGRVEAASEHVVEQPIPPEIPDDEPSEGAPSPGDTLHRLPLSIDWKVHGEAGTEGEVSARVR